MSTPAQAAPDRSGSKAQTAPDRSTPVSKVAVKAPAKSDATAAMFKAAAPVWPSAGWGDSTVSAALAPGGLPVRVLSAGPVDDAPRNRAEMTSATAGARVPVRVTVAGQDAARAAGVRGVLLQVSRADGKAVQAKAGLSVSYAKFASAYGANYGARLQLMALPACALSTPALPQCQTRTPVASTNDPVTQTVTAQAVPVAGASTMLALSAPGDGSSSEADWSATDLSPAYSWAAGTASGEFTLNYPIKVPASVGGPKPQLAFGYSSGGVDAKTASKTGQASVAGEGWDLSGTGYVERSFRSCVDDGGTTPDECWVNAGAVTLVFGGRSAKLIQDANGWHATTDDKLRIEDLTDSSAAKNYALNGEYWKVTTQDGTQYYFGKVHRYVGDTAAGANGTLSIETEPVIGNNAGEPCNTNANHACFQPYRWNLDYVVDPRGNTMTYFYDKLVAKYGFNNNSTTLATDLSSRLLRIEYGTRAGSEASTTAPMQVVFDYAERCWNSCSWPTSGYADTPTDLYCDLSATTCPNVIAPVHFTRYRLSAVRTQVYSGSAYRNVDKWDLDQTFLTSGDSNGDGHDDTAPNLWLNGLTHTGFAADGVTTQAEPEVTFNPKKLANRTDWSPAAGTAPFYHYRIDKVSNGVGGETQVHYLDPDCVNGAPKINGDANPFRCFPQYIKPPSAPAGFAYFNKYVVDTVTEHDLTGGTPDEVTSYSYSADGSSDTALWAHDDVDIADVTQTSWSDWRGYPTVTATKGTVAGQQTVTRNVYHRGLSGDAKKNGDDTAVAFNTRSAFTLEALLPGAGVPVGLAGGGTAGAGSQCLDILNGVNADGTALQSQTCNGLDWQKWIRRTDSGGNPTLQNPISGKCVDVKSSGTANGTQVWLWTCNNGAAQVWRRQPDGSLKNPNSGKCLDVSGHTLLPGGTMQIWDCNGLWGQVFMPTNKQELVRSQAVRCATAAGTTDGSALQDQGCGAVDNTANQTWQLQRDGSVVNPGTGKCMDVLHSGTANNTIVQLWTCNQGAAQQWVAQTDGTLKNPNSGRCLDGQGDAGLYIYDCSARLSQLWVGRIQDHSALNGEVRVSYTLNNGTIASLATHRYTATFTTSRAAYTTPGANVYSFMARETQTRNATWIAATGSWRWTEQDTTYDSYGLSVDTTNLGDDSTTADDSCVHIDYARNAASYMISYSSQSVITDCTPSPSDAHYLGGSQTYYDGGTTIGTAPTTGLTTQYKALSAVSGTTLTWADAGRATYDSYGRIQDSFDALSHKTMTRYTPATGGPVTALTETNPLGQVITSAYEPGHGLRTQVVDSNLQATNAQYDPLGRLTKVWLTGRATTLTPDIEYVYTLRNTAPTYLTSKAIGPNGNQIVTTTLYDGRLRERQSQSPPAQAKGGRMVTDTMYDARGLAVQQSTFWNSANAPNDTLVSFADADVPRQTRVTFDALERPTASALYAADVFKWQTTTAYDGDSTTVVPPSGGVPTKTTTDAEGNVTELRHYTAGSLGGASQATTYQYDRLNHLTKVTDAAGNQWTNTYDRMGRQTATTDPDAGANSYTYDAANRLSTVTDARNVTLAFAYDDLDRKTGIFDGSTSGTKRAEWVYDTVRKGSLTSSTRFVGTQQYTTRVDSYDAAGRPLSVSTTLPVAATLPSGTYTVGSTYNADGSVASMTYPAAGGLPQETVTSTYDDNGYLLSMAGLDAYVADTSYYGWGPAYQQVMGSGSKQVRHTANVDESTGRLVSDVTESKNQANPANWDERLNQGYAFDNAGNITSIKETSAGSVVANQCFKYDGLRELTEAWTTTAAACQAAPTQAVVGGADPYWTSYGYQLTTGNRTTVTRHSAAGDTTRGYVYPSSGATSVRPHAITQVNITGASTGTDAYTYGASGKAETRAVAGGPNQTLTWDHEGHLDTVTDGSGVTSYTYDADGGRLVAIDPQGTTAYLGVFDLRLQGGTTTATRYYGSVAVRTTTGGLTWLASDHQGTGTLTIDATSLAATRRRLDPYGNPRTTASILWPGNRGFVDGTQDNTGLTHLGSREYEPANGRFMSVDPMMFLGDPLAIGGYAYASNQPTIGADPSGLGTDLQLYPKNRNSNDSDMNLGKADPNQKAPKVTGPGNSNNKDNSATGPSHVVYSTPMSNGVELEILDDGNYMINGVSIPLEVSDPFQFAAEFADLYPSTGGYGEYQFTMTLVLACESGVGGCSEVEWMSRTKADVWYLMHKDDPDSVCDKECKDRNKWLADMGGPGALIGDVPHTQLHGGAEGMPAISLGKIKIGNRYSIRGCNSFTPDTLVLMADGTGKPIGEVRVGDKVVATDPESGDQQVVTVTAVLRNTDTDLTDLTVRQAGPTGAVIHTTAGHRFWSADRLAWVYASQLVAGERLAGPDGTAVTVSAVRTFGAVQAMYNLEVSPVHTYYVSLRGASVLVHNGCGDVTEGWHQGTFQSREANFDYHYNKHGAPEGVSREQYAADAQAWAASKPGRGYNADREELINPDGSVAVDANGKTRYVITYRKIGGGPGGTIADDGTVIRFWYH